MWGIQKNNPTLLAVWGAYCVEEATSPNINQDSQSVRYSTFCIALSGSLYLPLGCTRPTAMGSRTRRGKHNEAVAAILAELDRLPKGKALRIGSLGENQKGDLIDSEIHTVCEVL